MKKSEMFDIFVDKVCEVCEVRKEALIKGSKIQAVVDARILAVQYLRRIGLTSDDLALILARKQAGDMGHCPPLRKIKSKAKNIDRLFSMYFSRLNESYAFNLMSIELRDFCHESYAEYYLTGMKELPRK